MLCRMTKPAVGAILIAGITGAVLAGGAVFAVMSIDQANSDRKSRALFSDMFDAMGDATEAVEACRTVVQNYSDVSVELSAAVADQRSAIDAFFNRYDWWAGDAGRLYDQLEAPSIALANAVTDLRSTDFEFETCHQF